MKPFMLIMTLALLFLPNCSDEDIDEIPAKTYIIAGASGDQNSEYDLYFLNINVEDQEEIDLNADDNYDLKLSVNSMLSINWNSKSALLNVVSDDCEVCVNDTIKQLEKSYVKAFSKNDTIRDNQGYWVNCDKDLYLKDLQECKHPYCDYVITITGDFLVNEEKYVGYRIVSENETNYGWIGIILLNSSFHINLTGFAIN